ncbi:hypothetical protein PTUN_a2580 [Pseudoalteromonas tunicata]|nr:hypothetical protein PTUN_a2580 [Pseudoalteromonas tunicata]
MVLLLRRYFNQLFFAHYLGVEAVGLLILGTDSTLLSLLDF